MAGELRIALVAGEASGDLLGAGLARELKRRFPHARLEGMAGPAMVAAGVEPLWRSDEIAVMGLFEVLRHLPRLLALRRAMRAHWRASPPAVLVGIDAPDFTLGLERALRAEGVATVHYVSPSVWAWRPGRVKGIAEAAERVLCLLPFEPEWYAGSGTQARFVGHPAADQLAPVADRRPLRRALGLPEDGELVAVLPGSRGGEVGRLAAPFAQAIARVHAARPGVRFIAPMVDDALDARFAAALAAHAPDAPVTRVRGRSREALAAADLALCASGTATLEAMLLGTPMVVGYRLAPLTHWVLFTFGLVKARRFALPNIVAGRDLVPELMQGDCTGERLGAEVIRLLADPAARAAQAAGLRTQRDALAVGADARAADEIADLLDSRGRR